MIALTPRELRVLELLRQDRDGSGDGVPVLEVAQLAETRWPEGVIRRLRAHGFVVGEMNERYQLGHQEPVVGSTRTPGDGRPSPPGGWSSGVPVDPALRLFDLPALVEAA